MRKIDDEDDARRCLAAVKVAGGDAVAWARANGVDARSLNAWKVNLERRAARKPMMVELVPAPARTSSAVMARYALVVGDVRVEFDDACSGETLGRVLQVLRAC